MARARETFSRRLSIGFKALGHDRPITEAVKLLAAQLNLSDDRYIWQCVSLAKPSWQGTLERVHTLSDATRPLRPIRRAKIFLISNLIHGPKPAADLHSMARLQGISRHTLDRASEKAMGYVTKSRVGGSRGHWIWDLSTKQKKLLGLAVKDSQISQFSSRGE